VATSLLAHAARAADDAAFLEVDAPSERESTAALPLVEVRGRATARGASVHELVIVLDVSDSSVLPSGWDVDGDGARGASDPALLTRTDLPAGLPQRVRSEDFDDSVLAAELAATRALLARLAPGPAMRVGLVAFSDRAQLVAPVGSSAAALEAALGGITRDFPRFLRGTNFGDAIATAQLALQPETAGLPGTPRAGTDQSILLLSDGVPTLPPHGDRARQHALWAATAAGAAGIRIYAFDLSNEPAPNAPVLAEMASRSDGRFERLARPGDAIARLRRTDLAGLASLRVANATTGAPARALRTFPDGTFDAFVELGPGRNRIVFEATTTSGGKATAERVVTRAGAAGPDDAAGLVRELRRRTRETELWAEMERQRRTQKLDLEIRVDEAP
jgi:hypothetical protein